MEKDNINDDEIDYSKFMKPKKNPSIHIGEKYQANIVDQLNDKKIEKVKKEFNSYKEEILNENKLKKKQRNSKSRSNSNRNNENLLTSEGLLNKKRKINKNND